jgi:hypothetical protein
MGLFTSLLGKKAIVEKDDISGTFIAYYKGKEDIIGEGETKNEALKNLSRDVKLAERLKKQANNEKQYSERKPRIAHS